MLPKPDIKVGTLGVKYIDNGCWENFKVIGVKGRTIIVRYDTELTETFRWKTPGKWVPVDYKTGTTTSFIIKSFAGLLVGLTITDLVLRYKRVGL